MFNTQDLTLVGVNTIGDILRWTIFIVLALTAICLVIKKTKINKITIAPFMIVVTIIAAPFLLITTKENTKKETTPPKDDDIYSITVPKTNTTPNIPDVPEKQIVPEATILPETNTSSTPSSSSNTQQATNAQNNQSTTTDDSSSNEGNQDQNQGQNQNQGGNQGQDQPNNPDQPDEPEEPTLYHLTINNNDYVATDKSGDYEANAEIFIVAINREDDDYFFEGWLNGNNEIVSTEANYTFNMPASGLTLAPSYQSAKWSAVLDENNFEDAEVKLVIGETYQITIADRDTYEPIIITSDDENIATVDSETGIITAASAGSVSVFVEGSLSQRSRTLQATIYNSRVTIEFDAGVGNAVDDSVIFEGTALGSLPETSAEHYSFLGWFNENNEEITTSTTFNANTTLYAHWQIDTQTVTFDTHDGTTVDDAVLDYGSTLGEHTTTREGYDFQGWFTEENGQGTEYTANTEIYDDVELHAYWTKKVYDVTFNTHGGTTVDAITREHGDALGEITSTLARYHLVGWFTEENGEGTEYTADTQITSTVELHAYWEANQVTLSFDSVLGTEVDDITINEGASLTEIPETTRTDYIFGGWFTQTNGAGEELTTASVIEADTLYYAKWTYDTMPIVWQHEGICEFHNGSAITGEDCQEYAGQKYIDTGIQLYTAENYKKDFEVSFEIVEYAPGSSGDSQATFFNAKDPVVSTGLIIRREKSKDDIEINTNAGTNVNLASKVDIPYNDVQKITVIRQNGIMKYSINDSDFTAINSSQDLNSIASDKLFVLSAWFGGYPDSTKPIKDENNNTISYQPKKFINAKFKNMYIKLEREAPYESSDDIVEFDPTNPALTGYQTKINSWKPQVTAFTEDTTTINNSVWGIAEETFWDGLKDNFEENHCLTPSYEDSAIDSWTNGTTDCSKPLAYDTEVNAGLNVYLYDEATSTRGKQVAYTKSTAGTISNMVPGQTYYWEKDGDSSVYGYVKATSSNVHRMIDAGSVRNVRDLGGLAVSYTDDSNVTKTGTLKYEKLIRGERLWTNKNGVSEIQNLGINKEYALIEPTGNSDHPSNDEKLENYIQRDLIHYDFDYGTNGYSIARQTVTEVMQDIINGDNVYFHCRIGSDRTGTLAYLLEGLLGVQDEDRYEEYELSYLSGHVDRARYYKQKAANNAKKFVYMMGYILHTQDVYNWYMAGTTDEDADKALIQDFRDAMINYN